MEKLKNICVYSVSNGIYLLLFFIFMFVFPVLAGAEDYVLVNAWGGYGSEIGQFSSPYGIAVDDYGNVYVADEANHRIQKFSYDGEFITMWGSKGEGPGQFDYPFGIAVDDYGNVYVADSGNDRIQKFCLILGDCNGDKNVSIDEVQKCINCFLLIENECCHRCDLDRNGEVTIDEVQKVINALLGIN